MMGDFLSNLAARSMGEAPVLQPRLASRFELASAPAPALALPFGPADVATPAKLMEEGVDEVVAEADAPQPTALPSARQVPHQPRMQQRQRTAPRAFAPDKPGEPAEPSVLVFDDAADAAVPRAVLEARPVPPMRHALPAELVESIERTPIEPAMDARSTPQAERALRQPQTMDPAPNQPRSDAVETHRPIDVTTSRRDAPVAPLAAGVMVDLFDPVDRAQGGIAQSLRAPAPLPQSRLPDAGLATLAQDGVKSDAQDIAVDAAPRRTVAIHTLVRPQAVVALAADDMATAPPTAHESREATAVVAGQRVTPHIRPVAQPLQPMQPVHEAMANDAHTPAPLSSRLSLQHQPAPAPTPTIRVTIGRIEVRATPAPAAPAPRKSVAPTAISLDEYMRRRAGNGR
jgi:hypothetical protein